MWVKDRKKFLWIFIYELELFSSQIWISFPEFLFSYKLSCKTEESCRVIAVVCFLDWIPSSIRSVRATLLVCVTRTAGTRRARWCRRVPSSPACTATPTAPRSRAAGYEALRTHTLVLDAAEVFMCFVVFVLSLVNSECWNQPECRQVMRADVCRILSLSLTADQQV